MRFLPLVIICALTLSLNSARADKFRVTITNLTNRQLITEPLCILHTKAFTLFSPGDSPSTGLAEMAEDGVLETLIDEVAGQPGVKRTRRGGFISAGDQGRFTLGASKARRISCVAMLATTNDGFFAIRNSRLPKNVGESVTVNGRSYDAGSEGNSESCLTVPGTPCSAHFARDTAGAEGSIRFHPGILGIGDLSASTHGWTEPVARVEIERIS